MSEFPLDDAIAEIARLRAIEPFVLWFFDKHDDDNRGGSREVGNYRSKESAQAVADKYNAGLIEVKNADAKRRWKAKHDEWSKTLMVEDEPTFMPVPLKTDAIRSWQNDDHYFISPLEFEDE